MLHLGLDNQQGTSTSSPSPDPQGKHPNMLVNFIKTKLYVDQMPVSFCVRCLLTISVATITHDRDAYCMHTAAHIIELRAPVLTKCRVPNMRGIRFEGKFCSVSILHAGEVRILISQS